MPNEVNLQATSHLRRYHIILIHFGRVETTQAAIESLRRSTKKADSIIIIDHAIEPLNMALSQSEKVIRPKKNAGYGAGLNVGLGVLFSQSLKPHDIVICMNNDVRVATDTLSELEDWWINHPKPALVGAVYAYINILTGRSTLQKSRQRNLFSWWQLSYIHGSFFAAPFEVFAAVSGVPTQYFLYWEDVALSQRVHLLGYPLVSISKLSIKHNDDAENVVANDQLYYLVRNGAFFLEHETNFLLRRYWWTINRMRYYYHRFISRKLIVWQALHDALMAVQGPRPTT